MLTNFRTTRLPLREEDHVFFQQQRRRVNAKGIRTELKRKSDAKNYGTKRNRSLLSIGERGDKDNDSVRIDVFSDVIDCEEDREEENADADVEENL